MEKELKFYEKKILNDKEFPIQLHINRVHEKRWYFSPHWHEHIELHYVVSGRTKFLLDQQEIPGGKRRSGHSQQQCDPCRLLLRKSGGGSCNDL